MLSKRSNSCSIAPFKACGTGRGLKNFGFEPDLTNNLALVEFALRRPWSSVEGRGLHVEGEGNMSRVLKKIIIINKY